LAHESLQAQNDYFQTENQLDFSTLFHSVMKHLFLLKKNLPTFLPLLFFGMFLLPNTLGAQISGTVFRDFNANGAFNTDEKGVAGVLVKAYDDNDPIASPTATATTAGGPSLADIGDYSLTGLAAGTTYRLEFSWPTSGTNHLGFLEPGAAGSTTVQFVANGTGNVHLGINPDGQYCPPVADLDILTTCAISGDPFVSGNNFANNPIVLRTEYTASGTTPAPTMIANAGQVGGYIHGLAFNAPNNRIFSANTLKRHASLGKDINGNTTGGCIYVSDLNAALPNASIYIDLVNDLSINVGQSSIPNNATRGLPGTAGNASLDATVFGLIGKVGLGDIDLSDDGTTLFVVNLFDRRVHTILTADVDNGAPYASSVLPDFPNYSTGCTNSVARPYGISFHDGDVYLGVVCTGETNTTTNTNADLVATIYRYDLDNSSGGGWTTAFTFPLTYNKGYAEGTDAGTNQWYNWSDSYVVANLPGGAFGSFTQGQHRPQPMLSDIEFDEDGSMVLGIMDRTGHQLGHRNTRPNNASGVVTGVTAGDVLRTFLNPATSLFELESAGVSGPYTTSGTGTTQQGPGGPTGNQGPGGGEFFWQDNINNNHSETGNGGLGICPGLREVVMTSFDPTTNLDAGGYIVLNNKNGSKVRGYQLYADAGFPPTSGTTGKGNGTGDMEFQIAPTPIEVGNYIWNDTDNDGVQDPTETGLANIALELWADTDGNGSVDAKVATTATDANGRYLFSKTGTNAFGVAENWTFFATDNDRMNQLNAYEIRVSNGQSGLAAYSLATQNSAVSGGDVTNNNKTDLRDSDASVAGGNSVIAFSTGIFGENNHTLDLGFKALSCEIILTTNISGCFDSNGNTAGGSSVATVQAIVDWQNNPSGETITVTCTGAASQTIDPATASKPAVLTFEVPANGAAVAITATFSTTTTCTATENETAPAGNCLLTPCEAGNTGGQVWRDFNGDGIQDVGETSGIEGVTVTAFDCDGNVVATTVTDYLGQYTFGNALAFPNTFRVEFSGLPALYKPTANGTDGRTDVQFITAAECDVDFGANAPSDYCQTNPVLMINCYVPGAYNGANSAGHTIVGIEYNYAADPDGNINGTSMEGTVPPRAVIYSPQPPSPTNAADHVDIGSTWGLAFDRSGKNLFAASLVKGGTSLGPGESTGSIYKINDPAGTASVSQYVDLNAVFGANTAGPNPHPTSTTNFTALGDSATNAVVGKVGLGDLSISNDFSHLYSVNLFDRNLYVIPTIGTLDATTIERFVIPNTGLPTSNNGTCPSADVRPFAVTVNNLGEVYVGAVCSGESASTGADAANNPASDLLTAYVWRFDGAAFSLVLSGSLKFDRDDDGGYTSLDDHSESSNANNSTDWEPWSNLVAITSITAPYQNEPLLADIGFDENDDMILGFRDRMGDCVTIYGGFTSSGDILKACKTTTGWALEQNAKCGAATTAGANNHQGPGGGEFFFTDIQGDGLPNSGTGGIFILPGTKTVISTAVDPVYTDSNGNFMFAPSAGGVQVFRADGSLFGAYNLFDAGDANTFAKAAGVGAISALCNAAPLQIGNYVWLDTDKDGTQDPCETPLAGVKVALYKEIAGNFIYLANTTTGANGEYYFTGIGAAGENWTATSGTDSLLPNMNYKIVFGTDGTTPQFAGGKLTISGIEYVMTDANSGEGTTPDLNDSDSSLEAIVGGNFPSITLTTGGTGSVNHTFDAGFRISTCEKPFIGVDKTVCSGDTLTFIAFKSLVNQTDSVRGEWSFGAGSIGNILIPSPATNDSLVKIIFNNLSTVSRTDSVFFATIDGCFDTVLVTINPLPTTLISGNLTICAGDSTVLTASGGATYLWSNGKSTAPITVLTAGIYTVTATSASGCMDTESVTLIVNPVPSVSISGDLSICTSESTVLTASGGVTYVWSTTETTDSITISTAGNYIVTATAANGCTNTASGTLVINPLPTITVSGDLIICAGGSTVLTASGGLTYVWSNAETTDAITVSTAGNYDVIAIDSNGCSGTTSVNVVVNQPGNAGTPTNPASICAAANGLATVDLFAQLAGEDAGGTWTKISGPNTGINFDASAGTFNPNGLIMGVYVFKYTVAGGASCPPSMSNISVTISDCAVPCPPKACLPISVTKNN
jgi:SdrD B-like domain